jgi:hypothetical protein
MEKGYAILEVKIRSSETKVGDSPLEPVLAKVCLRPAGMA